jgi:hypothetical protein
MALEQLFASFKSDKGGGNSGSYDPNDADSYNSFIQAMISDARDYEGSVLAENRNDAQSYFYGYLPGLGPGGTNPAGNTLVIQDPNATYDQILGATTKETANRSTYVSTDVRDAIMLMLPALIRLFGASEAPVYLVPRSQQEVDQAQQATDYVNYVFWNDNPGFLILYGALKDALTVKTGFVKWWCDENKETVRKKFTNITADQIHRVMMENPTAKLIKLGKVISDGMPKAPPGPRLVSPPPSLPPGIPQMGGPSAPPMPGPPASLGGQTSPGTLPGVTSTSPKAMGGVEPVSAPPPSGGPPPGALSAPTGPTPPMGTSPTYDEVIIQFELNKPLIRCAGVPPEEMRLDRYARSFKDSRIVGHERVVPVDQMIAMGYTRELCLDHIQSQDINEFTMESQLRNAGRSMSTRVGDGVLYGEWFIKADKDGDGSPELRYICTMGEDHVIVHDEEANRVKFALFSCDPISHTIVGDSIADYTKDIQRIKTNMMRGVLDSLAESINAKTVINELMVNLDDALNDDLGAVIRTRGDPSNTVMFANTPFVGQQAMPIIDALNAVLERRTGLSDAAKGLDPKALQSSTQIGVEAIINGAQERVELVARVLCETGFKDLFVGLYNEICENPNPPRTLRVHGAFVPYDTSTFDASMAVEVNANLGKGSDMVRMVALSGIKTDQQALIAQMGINNPICGIPELMNTETDLLAIANVKNVGRYFKMPTPDQLQQLLSAPKAPDAQMMAAQAMIERVRMDGAKAVGQQHIDTQRMQSENEFKHRQLQAKTQVDLQKLELQGQQMGVDHHMQLAELASKLMADQQAGEQQDQQSQNEMADQQMKQNQQGEDNLAASHQAVLQAAAQAAAHRENMAKIDSGHTQAMTDMAARHHQAMTGHAVKGAGILSENVMNAEQRQHEASQGELDRSHEATQSGLDRRHQAETTAATLSQQEKIAKMKPKGPAK